MADLEAIISGAVDANRDSFDTPEAVIESDDSSTVDDTGTDTGTDDAAVVADPVEPVVVADETDPALVAAKAAQDAEDAFAKEHGLKLPKQGERENRIPYTQVKKIVGNAEKKLAEVVLGKPLEAGKDLYTEVKARVARLPELETKVQEYESEMGNMTAIGQLMETDPAKFLQMLPFVNPEYAKLIGAAAETVVKPSVAKGAPRPEPDYDLGVDAEGKSLGKTFSDEGLLKLLEWQSEQTKASVLEAVGADLKPFKDANESNRRMAEMAPKIEARVNYARKSFAGFTANEDAILAVITASNKTNRPVGLEEAYIQVIDKKHAEEIAKLTTDREKIRKEIIAEMKKAPTSTTVVPKASTSRTAIDTGEPKPIEDVIVAAMRAAKM